MTFSIAARCAESGMFGIAISSSSPAVAARCAFARSGVGAVATQNITNPALGPALLEFMVSDQSAERAVNHAHTLDAFIEYRQLLCVDANGGSRTFSGEHVLGRWAHASTANAATGGNLLADECVPTAMLDAFDTPRSEEQHFGDRLLRVLSRGLEAGGEAGPVHSAGLLIVDQASWPVVDLRIDWHDDCPIVALSDLWHRYKPQINDYVTRALDPTSAPSYGVPGDR